MQAAYVRLGQAIPEVQTLSSLHQYMPRSSKVFMSPSLNQIPATADWMTTTAHNKQLSITRKPGHSVAETALADGSIRLTVQVAGGAA